MIKWNCIKKISLAMIVCIFLLSGCLVSNDIEEMETLEEAKDIDEIALLDKTHNLEATLESDENIDIIGEAGLDVEEETYVTNTTTASSVEADSLVMEIVEMDWSEYFKGLNGAAVIFDSSKKQYMLYNNEYALTRRSPCSTFKIISSLVGLEHDVIPYDNTMRTWSGEVFWNDNWNKDINFKDAFTNSCIWYFREVINELGNNIIQEELNKLQYGNADISDWEGRLNTSNNNRALTGFWIESSLEISPKEQVEVMKRIFEGEVVYKPEALRMLKEAMSVTDIKSLKSPFYGKTGMGKKDGIVVDAWYTGFTETPQGNVYFCVYLGRSDEMNVTSFLAKEIAIKLISDYCNN